MRTALALALVTLVRSPTARVCTALAVLATPVFATAMVLLARSGQVAGPAAAKFEPLTHGSPGTAVAIAAGQVLPVVMLLATGFVSTWLFGREWSDGTVGGLFALPVARWRIAAAKLVVLAAWVVACVTLAVGLTTLGVVLVGGSVSWAIGSVLVIDQVAGLLMGALALPFGWVAVRSRGYLGAVGGIIAVTAISQILASVGVGRWVPYVAPAMWAGAGGPDAAQDIAMVHLAWAVVFAVIGSALTIHAFARARLD